LGRELLPNQNQYIYIYIYIKTKNMRVQISRCLLQTRIKRATNAPLHRKHVANAPQTRRKRAANALQSRCNQVTLLAALVWWAT
jgi:hypothetical protein